MKAELNNMLTQNLQFCFLNRKLFLSMYLNSRYNYKPTKNFLNSFTLYILTILIWGTTWIAIKFQIQNVSPLISVPYRFLIAAFFMFLYCYIRKIKIKHSFKDHIFMWGQGIFLFGINYWLVYKAEIYLPSGLVAVTYSTLMIMNVINSFIFLRLPVTRSVLLGSFAGIIGILLIFSPEITNFKYSINNLRSVSFGFLSALSLSFGNIIAARNQKHNLSLIPTTAISMSYGSVTLLLVATITGKSFMIPFNTTYLSSLLYLSIFGSLFAYYFYLTLIERLGASKASYAIILVPVVALIMSSIFENYSWNWQSLSGVMLLTIGNFTIIDPTNRRRLLSLLTRNIRFKNNGGTK